jgi:hypothetical protein
MEATMKKIFQQLSVLISSMTLFGCAIKPASSNFLDYQTKTNLIFPLTGESLIGTGGRTINQNPDHIYAKDQRFAIDVVALAPGSSPPELTGLVNRALSGKLEVFQGEAENYKDNFNHYCFGRQIIATGEGVVVDSKDGIFDNVPGNRNAKGLAGNYVVIDHLNGEFSMLAHFQKGSVLVKKGDTIKAGDPIGRCGNSGNSNLPHLHYHLQNSSRWHDGEALPAQFNNYYANNVFMLRGEPVQGEIITSKKVGQ